MKRVADLATPAAVIDLATLNHNIDSMAQVRPGRALRSHVKAHKCTELARYAADRSGSDTFCAATLREAVGLIHVGLGSDVLLANETLNLEALTEAVVEAHAHDARLTVAIDSPETLSVAAGAQGRGHLDVLIDVNVGMPRCGVAPDGAGALADAARGAGLNVRGVMGYEGHVVGNVDRGFRVEQVAVSMEMLRRAHAAVGGEVTSAGGTGTFDLHDWVGEVQAGSYLLMDSSYSQLDLPFRQAFSVVATVISVNRSDGYAVADAGLKAFGMDHGEPTIIGHTMFFTSDEHVTFIPGRPDGIPGSPDGVAGSPDGVAGRTGNGRTLAVGDRIELVPGHIDPTMALHERVHLIERRNDDGTVPLDAPIIDTWPVDLRNW